MRELPYRIFDLGIFIKNPGGVELLERLVDARKSLPRRVPRSDTELPADCLGLLRRVHRRQALRPAPDSSRRGGVRECGRKRRAVSSCSACVRAGAGGSLGAGAASGLAMPAM